MQLEFTRSLPDTSGRQKFFKFGLFLLLFLILLTFFVGYFLNETTAFPNEPELSENHDFDLEYQELILTRQQLQEQLSSYDSQPDLDVNQVLLILFQNLSLLLPQEVILSELRCSEEGTLVLRGQCEDLSSISALLEDKLLPNWNYEGSMLKQREAKIHDFQLEYRLKNPGNLP